MKVAILGFGREGQSLLGFLRRTPKFRGAEVTVLDKTRQKIPRGVKSMLGKNYLSHLEQFDVIFRSPGIPYSLPQLQRAKKHGVVISSATKLFFSAIGGSLPVPVRQAGASGGEELSRGFPPYNLQPTISNLPVVIGITGTKGKGTTATLLYKMLKASGKRAYLAGNIGTPALDLLGKYQVSSIKYQTFIVLELSSFQLQDLETSPHIAAILDVFPDHQDVHKNLAEYYAAKATIARYQKKEDMLFFSTGNAMTRKIARTSPAKKIEVGEKNFRLFSPRDLHIPGTHNFKNAVMAATIARHLGVPITIIRRVVRTFRSNEHRLEFVRRIQNVEFWNDSASTIPHATAAAVQAFQIPNSKFQIPVILIAGGRQKVNDYSSLAKALREYPPEYVVLIGENKRTLSRLIKRQATRDKRQGKCDVVLASDLKDAIQKAHTFARSLHVAYPMSRVAIVFSPGAASFDMFPNYAARGRQFKKLVRELKV